MEEKPLKPPRRRLPPMSAPVSDAVLSFFLDSPSSPDTSHKAVSWDEPVLADLRRTSVALNRDGDQLNRPSRPLPRSTSSSSSMSIKSSKKRPRSLANHLGGFVLHSVTPRESSILQYTSIVSPGTHTEYELVLEDSMVASVGERWVVSRRYSGFRSLRDELARVFDRRNHPGAAIDKNNAHCSHCAPMVDALDKLSAKYFPKRRLWGSKSPKIVQQRAEQFFQYLQGLLALATNPSTRRCPLVALGFAVQLRTFFTLEREPYRGTPGAFGGGAVPFLLNEMTQMAARPDNATTLMTIDELDAAYADTTDDHSHTSSMRSMSDLPSPVCVLEEQDELRSWDELDWEDASVASSGWSKSKR
ncbi:hypothetical protein KRP22_004883 [Phytophthora ramorum]|uniref:uncharacterized protein n=1 Tax=Phytophthora ramorum TaxID=164328 RepID=UPI003097A9A8|nr:hypothetical protein KRP23_13482 [Phytophthora ramorum]KAH7497404.1 hypothetical protein KRP22_12467 [Phytophthora ramorum]